ncbi:MAG: RimK family alpha-L-glutamate ligase [Planctomycetes bacterium]|nr:RimK family alpha-L-glutamate ligase [Planctomycetota bacterium]
MRIGVLAQPGSWYLADLTRAAQRRGHSVLPLEFRSLQSTVESQSMRVQDADGTPLNLDAVVVRTMPPGSLEQVVFRMDLLGQLDELGVTVWNAPRSMECAVDKFLTTARMRRAGLLVPATRVCQTEEAAMVAFEELGGDVVLKPLFGGEGRGITRLTDPDLAQRAFRLLTQLGSVIYLQKFIAHLGCDYRILLIGDEPFCMCRRNPSDWRSNVSRGATTEPWRASDTALEMARTAARAVGAAIAGVDLLPGRDGQLYAIEVNAVPGWRALARTVQVDIADRIVAWVERPGATQPADGQG